GGCDPDDSEGTVVNATGGKAHILLREHLGFLHRRSMGRDGSWWGRASVGERWCKEVLPDQKQTGLMLAWEISLSAVA
ncbi:hypothetical protein KW869_08805, partial [Pseudomonas urmiensis]